MRNSYGCSTGIPINLTILWLKSLINKSKTTDRDKIIILTVTILEWKSNGQLVMSGGFILGILITNICQKCNQAKIKFCLSADLKIY